MHRPRVPVLVALAGALFAAGFLSGILLDRQVLYAAVVPRDGAQQFDLVAQAWNLTRRLYVDRPAAEAQRLAYGAIDGMIASLGDVGHSRFLTPEEVRLQQDLQSGQFEGVGIEVQVKDNQVVVVAPIEGSPAQKAGIRSGDVIVKVNGQPVTSLDDAVHRILGPAGTAVTLTVLSAGQTRDVPLVRAQINIAAVTWHQAPGTTIAHVRISTFSNGASEQLRQALSAARQEGDTGLILDLRDDPGGLLDEAVAVSSAFLKSGDVLLEKSADGTITPVPVQPEFLVEGDIPLVVLINGGSASGAEIVAGALQDAGRAKLVGETTFGTGTVLQQFPLRDGSAVLLAIQEWLTPSGRTIWHKGLAPDIVVALPANTAPVSPRMEAGMSPDQLQKSGDAQLLKAISLLSGQN